MTGLVVGLLLLAAVGGVWWSQWGRHMKAARHRRGVAEDADLALTIHDFTCDTGRWPHAEPCTVDPDKDDFLSAVRRWHKLEQCSRFGIGNVPPPFTPEEVATVEANLGRKGTLLVPRSCAGDFTASRLEAPGLPTIEFVDDDDPRLHVKFEVEGGAGS